MKKFRKITLFLVLLLCSCSGETIKPSEELSFNVETMIVNQTITELSSKTYTKEQLEEIAEFKGSIEELNDIYPIECVRKSNGYRISYLGESHVAVTVYDDGENWMMSNVYKLSVPRSNFADLAIGCTLEDVQKVDKNGFYWFYHTGVNSPRLSEHYTEDGYMIQIQYDQENRIILITEEMI